MTIVRKAEERVKKQAEEYLRSNPDLAETLELFRVTNEQYASALQALSRPQIRVSNSTNED